MFFDYYYPCPLCNTRLLHSTEVHKGKMKDLYYCQNCHSDFVGTITEVEQVFFSGKKGKKFKIEEVFDCINHNKYKEEVSK